MKHVENQPFDHSSYAPAQGQKLDLTTLQIYDAEQHMQRFINHEVELPNATVGWSQQAAETHPDNNEDQVLVGITQDGASLFAMYDGAGGHKAGDVASSSARQVTHDAVRTADFSNPSGAIEGVFETMSDNVNSLNGGGTTASMLLIEPLNEQGSAKAYFGSVGDSLMYIVRKDGSVQQLNNEETLEQEMIKLYALDPSAAIKAYKSQFPDINESNFFVKAHTVPNVLTNMIGEHRYEGLENKGFVQVSEGDIIVMTTDGVTGDFAHQKLPGRSNEAAIAIIARDSSLSPREKADRLIALAGSRENGRIPKTDDRSAMVIEIKKSNTENNAGLAVNGELTPQQKAEAEDARLREAHKQNELLADQVTRLNVARAAIETAPVISQGNAEVFMAKDALKTPEQLLQDAGFGMNEQVAIRRGDKTNPWYSIAQVTNAFIDETDGELRVNTVWYGPDKRTGEIKFNRKALTATELQDIQKRVLEGDIAITR